MSQQRAHDPGDSFERLVALLEADDAPKGRMTLSMLDGFIAALTVGPDIVLPSQWMPLVWGPEGPVFENQDEAQAMLTALMHFYNDIVGCIHDRSYTPVFDTDANGKTDATCWCLGFLKGMEPHHAQWRRFIDSNNGYFLLPVYAHIPALTEGAVTPDDIEGFDPDVDIPFMITRLYDHWRAETAESTFSSGVKAGRNDPCPCGSGRKFKRCCLNADAGGVLPGLPGEH